MKSGKMSFQLNDLNRAEICCFTSTGKKIIRHYSLRTITTEAVMLYNLREEIARILVK
jgi:hypothetical protein